METKISVVLTTFISLMLSFVLSGTPLSAQAPSGTASVAAIDAADVILDLADALDQGKADTAARLSNLGHREAVENILSIDGQAYSRFSARTLIETLYRQAEATSAEEGKRFLATLVKDADLDSIATLENPVLKPFRVFTPDQLNMKKKPIQFSPLSQLGSATKWTPHPPAVNDAIRLMADHYAGASVGRLRAVALRLFRNESFKPGTYERILAESPDTETALKQMMNLGTPPPTKTEAALELLRYHMSETIVQDQRFLDVIKDLSRELPSELQRYVEAEDSLESRQRQVAEAERVGLPGKIEKPDSKDVTSAINRKPGNPDSPTGGGGRDGPAGGSPSGGAPGPGSGGGGGGDASDPKRSTRNYTSYNKTTFDTGPNRPSRKWSRAIRSSRAARGIAVGGEVDASDVGLPLRAIWYPNAEDGRFGRLFIAIEGEDRIAISRTMFADSFYAAVGLLWGDNKGDAVFREGEILILMSLNPFGDTASGSALESQKLAGEYERLEVRALRGEDVESEELILLIRLIGLLSKQEGSPRDVVIHPALFGRELAWSAVRVDFWFNDTELLSKEAAAMNGGRAMPLELQRIDFSEVVTWQFYEHDVRIRIGGEEGDAVSLVIDPVASYGPTRPVGGGAGRFGISMFGESSIHDESEELPRLKALEANVQQMLNWLFVNHHDFMRLRDVSDSFAILRWLRAAGASVTAIDMDGQSRAIATPDGVKIGIGPIIVSGLD